MKNCWFQIDLSLVALMFVWAATLGAIFGSYTAAADRLIDDDVYIFGVTFMNEIIGNCTLRMAGVYMLSIGFVVGQSGRDAALVNHHYHHGGSGLPVFCRFDQRGALRFPRLGVFDQCLYFGSKLSPHKQPGHQGCTIGG
jgi:hypothetical protein